MSAYSKTRVPSYRLHKQSGQAVVTLADGVGGRRDVLLGKYGTKGSKAEYRRIILEWEASDRRLPRQIPDDITIVELIDRYWQHCQTYYRRLDGSETKVVSCMMYSLRPLNYLHGNTPVKDFGPSALKAVRELMIHGYKHPKYGTQEPLCRNEINKRIKRIRRMMKWGIENEIVPSRILVALQSVAPLKRGRSEAHDTMGVTPIARALVLK